MPPFSAVQVFINAVNTGRTHITLSLDAFFGNPEQVQAHPHWNDLLTPWTAVPSWLSDVLDVDVGLTVPERNHVLAWPVPELETARIAAVNAVSGVGQVAPTAPKFFWELYKGPTPRTDVRVSSSGDTEIVFQSPRRAVVVEGDQVFVRDVALG